MKGRRYSLKVSGMVVMFRRGGGWFYSPTGDDDGRAELTAAEVARVKKEADRIGGRCDVRPIVEGRVRVTAPRRAKKKVAKRAGPAKLSKAAQRKRMLANLAKGRATRARNLKNRNR